MYIAIRISGPTAIHIEGCSLNPDVIGIKLVKTLMNKIINKITGMIWEINDFFA